MVILEILYGDYDCQYTANECLQRASDLGAFKNANIIKRTEEIMNPYTTSPAIPRPRFRSRPDLALLRLQLRLKMAPAHNSGCWVFGPVQVQAGTN